MRLSDEKAQHITRLVELLYDDPYQMSLNELCMIVAHCGPKSTDGEIAGAARGSARQRLCRRDGHSSAIMGHLADQRRN